MVQLANVNKSHCAMKDKLYLKGLFHRIRALIALNCSIIFVTDGSIPGIKVSSYRRRLQSDNEGTREEPLSDKTTSLQRNMGSEFSCMIKEAKILGSALGVPCLDGIEEGEAQCALLDSESLCDGCFSSDSDTFLFGATTVYRDICLGEGGYVVCYEMADIEKKLGFGRNSLIALAVLLGSDYSSGVRGVGPELACKIVKSLGEAAVLHKLASEDLSLLKKANCSKKCNQVCVFNDKENIPPHASNINGPKGNLTRNNQFQQVMDAYLKPKCHSADSQMVQRVLGVHPFQRIMLQRTCHRYFEWPAEKTDEYILPKIAERELRRFANLRFASSNLGVQLPLDKMPVKCPISEIVKRRQAQGKECFEVLWEDIDGLASSIVPGDLVKSACLEKIVEFEENLAEKKKPKPRKPRLKKTDNNKSVDKVDLKLQELLLEIEGTRSHSQNYGLHDTPLVKTRPNNEEIYQLIDEPLVSTRPNIEENYQLLDGPLDVPLFTQINHIEKNYQLLDEPMGNMRSDHEKVKMTEKPADSCDIEPKIVNLSTPLTMKGNRIVDTEIVDLLSPLSLDCLSKHHQNDADVIDLSESDMDVSPEHAKKAKELRLFVAKIKGEWS
uniref:single-strand DNA endonuclease 1 n=1 Tax=Erigeron canadensis TaxID=72917 RepID=UPI001CB9B608|nr:single-strand DNA endonuclease 1 [Erigeron canadensis]